VSTKTIHSGYYEHPDGSRVYQYADDADCMNPELREYQALTITDFSFLKLMELVREGEAAGNEYVIQIGDFYYETLPEEEA
jgi:hypothetical protein